MQLEVPFPTHSSTQDQPSHSASRDAQIAQPLSAIDEAENEGRRFMSGIAMAFLLEVAVAACVYGLWHAFLLIQ